jgi:CBS domain-containing protein
VSGNIASSLLGGAVNQVAEILAEKGRDVLRIDGGSSVLDAVRTMVEANIGSLLVTDGDDIAGIVTERDYLRRVTLEGRSEDAPVREIMTSPLIVVTPETEIEECMAMMTDRRIRHLPVVEDDEVVGIVSIGDIVKFRSKQQSFEIKYLTDYITAS